jgi:hypothetical protein
MFSRIFCCWISCTWPYSFFKKFLHRPGQKISHLEYQWYHYNHNAKRYENVIRGIVYCPFRYTLLFNRIRRPQINKNIPYRVYLRLFYLLKKKRSVSKERIGHKHVFQKVFNFWQAFVGRDATIWKISTFRAKTLRMELLAAGRENYMSFSLSLKTINLGQITMTIVYQIIFWSDQHFIYTG